MGMQLPEGEEHELEKFIDNLGYHAEEETDNEACSLFLG